MNKNVLLVQRSEIIKNLSIAKDTFLLQFKSVKEFFPTQFLMIDTYPSRFLLKPFTVVDYSEQDRIVSIIYRLVGEGTKFLSQKKAGEVIKYIGPLGNKEKIEKILFRLKKLNYDDNKIVLIGGGSGIASIIYLYKKLLLIDKNILVFYGEKDKKYVINLQKFGIKNVVYTTDNGSFGKKGFVTDIFRHFVSNNSNYKSYFVFTCGPKGMLENLQKIVEEYKNVKGYALLEEYMCCGVGVCRSCVVKIKSGRDFVYQTICKEGPLFDINEIIF